MKNEKRFSRKPVYARNAARWIKGGLAALAAATAAAASLLFGPPAPASATNLAADALSLESRSNPENAATQALAARLEEIATRTKKRIHDVFGINIEVRLVVESSGEHYDFQLTRPDAVDAGKHARILLINSRLVRDYTADDLEIATARVFYNVAWPKFRKTGVASQRLIERMYEEGMTAYAAELLFPGALRWKYAGLYGSKGNGQYQQYLSSEKKLAEEVMEALLSGATENMVNRLFPTMSAETGSGTGANGRMLSYRIMKTLETVMDPKMIQLMDIIEYQERLLRSLDSLKKGFVRSRGR